MGLQLDMTSRDFYSESVDGVVGCLQKLEAVDTGIEGVQSDVRQLTDERDNIRSTFDDLTLKVIHLQVRTVPLQRDMII